MPICRVETYALGFPFYELIFIVLKYGKDEYQNQVHEKPIITISYIGKKTLMRLISNG